MVQQIKVKTPKRKSKLPVTEKYASRFLNEIISSTIAKTTETKIKNQKTITKWCEKMKLSILRKVSLETSVLFSASGKSDEELLERITQLKDSIGEREQKIKINSIQKLKSASLLSIPVTNGNAYESGEFKGETERITDKLGSFSEKMKSIQQNMQMNVNSLQMTIDVTEERWKHMEHPLKSSIVSSSSTHFQTNSKRNSDDKPTKKLATLLQN